MTELIERDERERRILELYDKVLEIEQRLIPSGLHVFGRPPIDAELEDMLCMVASFDRPEIGLSSLPDLLASALNLPDYPTLLSLSATSEEHLRMRERVEAETRSAVRVLLSSVEAAAPGLAADWVRRTAGVPVEESIGLFRMLDGIRRGLGTNGEIEGMLRALRSGYVEPGPGSDIVQNPSILPTGRNTHAVNPYHVPSELAMRRAIPVAEALIARHRGETGRYPESIAMVLWGIDNIKSEGEPVAQVLSLLGVRPKRDSLNRVSDVEVIPLDRLGRPRIDVVMSVSGIFRDLFGATMTLLDRAVRMVAGLDEPLDMNFVARHVRQHMDEASCTFDDAVIRVFSNAPGNYGTNVNFMVLDSQWEDGSELGNLFVTRKCFAYGTSSDGRSLEGREARGLLERALSRVDVTYQNIDSAEVGITDVDHYFEYLGGVSKAVEERAGGRPSVYLSDTLSPSPRVRTLEETVGIEARAKLLNPRWYEGMLRHGFSGVAEIEHQVTNTFGWSATTAAVDDWVYDGVAETYILDETMLNRLRELNPHSAQVLVGRLLEASGRGLWSAESGVLERLRQVFSGMEDQLEGVAR